MIFDYSMMISLAGYGNIRERVPLGLSVCLSLFLSSLIGMDICKTCLDSCFVGLNNGQI